jgi:hypothetical protein
MKQRDHFNRISGQYACIRLKEDPLRVIMTSSTPSWSEGGRHEYESPKSGRLGVGMITTASAAFDTYAYLLFGKDPTSRDVSKRIRKLVRDRRFFGVSNRTYPTSKFFYDVVRNGVVHQFYPKNADIYPRHSGAVQCQTPRAARAGPSPRLVYLHIAIRDVGC